MKRFTFTLQAVLTLRQREERTALEGYAAALRERQRAVGALEEAVRSIDALRRLRLQVCETPIAAHEHAQLQIRTEVAEQSRIELSRLLARAETVLANQLKAVLMARQRREAVEHCRSMQMEEHLRLEAAEEARLLDELAARRSPVHLSLTPR